MPAPPPCPVVGCRETASASLIVAVLPAGGPGVHRFLTGCPRCWRAVGAGAGVEVQVDPTDIGRRRARVVLTPPDRSPVASR